MQTVDQTPKPKLCRHCGKILRLLAMPRDLGLLLNVLLYRVPIDAEIGEAWIDKARQHCRMKPERLAELRAGDHARHWPRMIARRAARLAYFKQHGELPPRWMALLPGERDHVNALAGIHRYRKGGLAKLKAKLRKHPETASIKLTNRYMALQHVKSPARREVAIDDLTARLLANLSAGKLTLIEYEALKAMMSPDDGLPGRQAPKTGLSPGSAEKKSAGKLPGEVPQP